MIRVLVVDDHSLVRAGLEQLLARVSDIDTVGTASNGREAVALAELYKPDLVLMDLSMPQMDGIEATRVIVGTLPLTRVVVLTTFSDRARIIAAVEAGAVGYLLKDNEPQDLIAGIRAAAQGDSPIAPRAASTLMHMLMESRRGPRLTVREREVLSLVGDGLDNRQIAAKLGISYKTVKTHLTSAFQRIGVTNRTSAARWAYEHGLIEDRVLGPTTD